MIFDPNGEILRQLTRIADATNKSAPSPWLDWLKTLLSFLAGLTTAFVSQHFQERLIDHREQKRSRRIVYLELSKNFIDLDSMVRPEIDAKGNPALRGLRFTLFRNGPWTFDGERYMQENTAAFYQLEEGEVLKWIYDWFHRLDVPKHDGSNKFGIAELRGPLAFFSDCYRRYPTFKKNLKRSIPPSSFHFIDHATTLYKHVYSAEELVDSGMGRFVEKPGGPNGTTK